MDLLPSTFSWTEFLITLFIGDLLLTIVSVLIAGVVKTKWREYRHGGWRVHVVKGDQFLGEHSISADKRLEIKDDSAERDVFLKGRTSVYEWLNCDIADLLTINTTDKIYKIDLNNNPRKPIPPPWRIITQTGDEWLHMDGRTLTLNLDTLQQLTNQKQANDS